MQKVRINIINSRIVPFLLLNLFIFSTKAYTQEISIFASKTNIHLNEKFSIIISFPKDNKRDFKVYHQFLFPDIDNFEKGRTLFLEEEDPKGYKIIQYYKPRKTGNFDVNSFQIKVKDKVYTFKKTNIKVIEKGNISTDQDPDPKIDDKLEFEEPKLEVLLDVKTSKQLLYQGEGVGVEILFLISTQNKAEITFIDIEEQRKEFLKKLKPGNCFIEDFPMSNQIESDTVVVNEKKYTKWKLYEGVFFPMDSNTIKIPSLNFSILTYKTAKNKQQSVERELVVKKLNSKPMLLKVVALPKSNAKEQSIVGYYKLTESVSVEKFQTGKSFKYTFTIIGEGNVGAIPSPNILSNEAFDIYAPKITQSIFLQNGKVTGSKSFVYYVTPKEPGSFDLSKFVKWAYFNTSKGGYDTLTSTLSLKVRGESLKNNYISTNNPGDFYSRINTEDNTIKILVADNNVMLLANILILFMLVSTGILVVKK